MKYFIGELIGTYILSSSLNFMATYKADGTISISLVEIIIGFLIAIQIARKLSGAHVNPAVTLTFYINTPYAERQHVLPQYREMILGQLVGALLCPLFSQILIGNSLTLKASTESNFFTAFVMEMLGSAVFYSVILFQGKKEFNLIGNDEVISSIVVAMGLAGGISIAGNESGAGLNPAISFCQNLVTFLKTKDIKAFNDLPIYLFAPVVGAFLANSLFDYFLLDELSKDKEEKKQEVGELRDY